MTGKGIFIAATGQDVGKTTTSLGLLSGLRKRFKHVGFIKPIGQKHVQTGKGTHVDKDVVLFREYFDLEDNYANMSPVIIPSGFTRDFLDGKQVEDEMIEKIIRAYSHITDSNDYTLVEGTGHVGVGSICNLNNARVARLLNLDMVIIVPAGLGSAFDTLALNMALCEQHNVKVRGIIVNRVQDSKRDMLLEYLPKALARWDVPIIGAIPYDDILGKPSMRDFEVLFQKQLLAGTDHRFRRFDVNRIGARSLEAFCENHSFRQLTIAPASREDIVYEVLERHDQQDHPEHGDWEGGMILTGRKAPNLDLVDRIRKSKVPVLYVPISSYNILGMVTSFTAKMRNDDQFKIGQAIRLVESQVDFDALI